MRQAGPGICGRKYVEDAKAARSVRVWDRVPMKNKVGGIKTNARSVRGWDRVPMKKQDQGGKSSLEQPCCPIAAPISRVEA